MNKNKEYYKGSKRELSRLLSQIENEVESGFDFIKENHKLQGNSYVIGITGQPGCGKSTLTNKLALELINRGNKVAVIAVDPTSPFTGGAILGDRIRMVDIFTHENAFIRSMGTRGSLGGLSKSVNAAIKLFDIFGYDYIIVETVGVGQSEVDIAKTCDTTLLVMVPGLGDDIQAIKAGIMEIGDVFVINKADRDGVDKVHKEVEMMLELSNEKAWRPPISKTIAINNIGINEVIENIDKHRDYQHVSGEYKKRRINNFKMELLDVVQHNLLKNILSINSDEDVLLDFSNKIYEKETNIYSAADELINNINLK